MKKNKTITASFIAIVTIAGLVLQFVLTMQKAVLPVLESVVHFFSYFTILTNLAVFILFSNIAFKGEKASGIFKYAETTGAITVYIIVVGLIYQIFLRGLYKVEGLNLLADNILHGFVPTATVIYWLVYESKRKISMKTIPKWLIYPGLYLVYTLIHGSISQFYPYPFMDVVKLGYQVVIRNSFFVMILFLILFFLFGSFANWRNKVI